MQYEHWRNCTGLDYLRAEVLQPKEEKVLTIKSIKAEEVESKNGTDTKPVCYFEEDVLPMVLNVKNCETIEKIYGTGNIYDWIGKKIQIFATTTKVAGESVPCLRVRDFIPKSNEIEYHCCVCNKNITKTTYDQSVAKYGKPYCSKECLDKDTKGEDLL